MHTLCEVTMDSEISKLEENYKTDSSVGPKLLMAYQQANFSRKYYVLRAELGYIAETIDLPIPTDQQCKNFVDYVANAHSWYKHLSYKTPTPFIFFLEPFVMMYHLKDGSVEEVTDKKSLFHYSEMLTSDYQEKYGRWTYLMGLSDKKVLIRSVSGKKIPISKELINAGTASVTSAVHGSICDTKAGGEERDQAQRRDHQAIYDALQRFLTEFKSQRQIFLSQAI